MIGDRTDDARFKADKKDGLPVQLARETYPTDRSGVYFFFSRPPTAMFKRWYIGTIARLIKEKWLAMQGLYNCSLYLSQPGGGGGEEKNNNNKQYKVSNVSIMYNELIKPIILGLRNFILYAYLIGISKAICDLCWS